MKFRGVQRSGGQVLIDRPFLCDASLSCKAKGLLAIMYSWPQDEHITVTALLKLTSDGRDAITKAWSELEKAGYLVETVDGVRIAENPQKPSMNFPENREKVSLGTFEASLLVGMAAEVGRESRIAENREKASMGFRDNREKADSPVRASLRKIAKSPPEELREIANGPSKPVVLLSTEENNTKDLSSSDEGADQNLFGSDIDEARQSIFRLSVVSKWEVFKSTPSMREAELLGIDVAHYHRRLLSWSNRQSPRVKKNQRTAHGWLSTAEDWMGKDKQDGKLVTVAGKQADDQALIEFLRMGR